MIARAWAFPSYHHGSYCRVQAVVATLRSDIQSNTDDMNYSQSNYSNGDDHRSIKRRRLQNQSSCPSFTNHQSYEPPQEAPAAPSFKAKDGSRMVWDQKAAKWVKEVEVKVEEPVNPAPSFTAKDGSRMVWDAKSAKWVKDISHQKSPTPTTFKSSYKPYGDRRHSQTDGGYQDHRYLASETFSAPASDVMYDPTQPANQTFTNETDHNHALYNPSSLSIDDLIRGLQNPTQHREPTESAKTHTPLQPSITAHPSPPVKAELPTPRDSQSPETTESTGIEQLFKDVDWSKASKKTLHDVFYHMDGEMFASYYDEDTTMKDDEPTTSTFQVKKKSNRTTCKSDRIRKAQDLH